MAKLYALAEVESLMKRAATGAGLAWGIAEELAKSVKFLSACEALSFPLLSKNFPHASTIIMAIELSDRMGGEGAIDEAGENLPAMTMPILALPILLRAANFHNKILHWQEDNGNWQAFIGKGKIYLDDDYDRKKITESKISLVKQLPETLPPYLKVSSTDEISIDKNSYDILWDYYMNTCVPENEVLRNRGAGSQKSDND